MTVLIKILKYWKYIVMALLISTTVSAAYVAKHQYDAKKNLEYRVEILQSNLLALQKDKDLSDDLVLQREKVNKELRDKLEKQVKAIVEEPDDGCLDKAAPAVVLDGLR